MKPTLLCGIACVLAAAASASFGAGEPPRSDDFELSGLAYVMTELEVCASLDPDLMHGLQAMLARDRSQARAMEEFHADPHYERFKREILQRQALARPDRVEIECRLMLAGADALVPVPR